MRNRPLLGYFLCLVNWSNQIIWFYGFRLLRCLCILLECRGTIWQLKLSIWRCTVLTGRTNILLNILWVQTWDHIVVRFWIVVLDVYLAIVDVFVVFIRFSTLFVWVERVSLILLWSFYPTILIHIHWTLSLTFFIF